jgi:hypothetical protein
VRGGAKNDVQAERRFVCKNQKGRLIRHHLGLSPKGVTALMAMKKAAKKSAKKAKKAAKKTKKSSKKK